MPIATSRFVGIYWLLASVIELHLKETPTILLGSLSRVLSRHQSNVAECVIRFDFLSR